MMVKCTLSCRTQAKELSSTCRTASWICPLLIFLNALRFLKMAAMRFTLCVSSIIGLKLSPLLYV